MSIELLPIRLTPGDDLRSALEDAVRHQSTNSAFVVSGIGSLSEAKLRYAGEAVESTIAGPLEIVNVSGSLSPSGAHLHMAVSDASGRVYGGHAACGNVIRTTAEVLIAFLPDGSLSRELDAATGFNELVVHRRP
jgi:predicted DNA-binding protein with PD1-like motif